jgi:hypothetical protein
LPKNQVIPDVLQAFTGVQAARGPPRDENTPPPAQSTAQQHQHAHAGPGQQDELRLLNKADLRSTLVNVGVDDRMAVKVAKRMLVEGGFIYGDVAAAHVADACKLMYPSISLTPMMLEQEPARVLAPSGSPRRVLDAQDLAQAICALSSGTFDEHTSAYRVATFLLHHHGTVTMHDVRRMAVPMAMRYHVQQRVAVPVPGARRLIAGESIGSWWRVIAPSSARGADPMSNLEVYNVAAEGSDAEVMALRNLGNAFSADEGMPTAENGVASAEAALLLRTALLLAYHVRVPTAAAVMRMLAFFADRACVSCHVAALRAAAAEPSVAGAGEAAVTIGPGGRCRPGSMWCDVCAATMAAEDDAQEEGEEPILTWIRAGFPLRHQRSRGERAGHPRA